MYSKNQFTNVYGFARTLLALSLLLTIIFNSTDILFPKEYLTFLDENLFLNKINLFLLFNYDYMWLSVLVSVIILILVLTGIYPKITGVLHWWVSFSFFNSSLIVEGGDQVISIITLLLIPITILDSRKNHWHTSTSKHQKEYSIILGNLFFLLIQIQASIIYLQAGVEKLYKVEEWRNGTAIYYWLNDSVFGASDLILNTVNTILSYPLITTIPTWSVVLLEITLSYAIFMKKYNKLIMFKFAIIFHFAIVIFHGLPTFFLAMSGLLILYLLPLEDNIQIKTICNK